MATNLSFDAILQAYITLEFGRDWHGDVPDHIRKHAQYDHSLTVKDATFDAFMSATNLPNRLQQERAQYFIRFGAARRWEMIWCAYRDLISTASPKREEPLNLDEGQRLTAALNLIYINIRGVLDNLCWALLHEKAPEKTTLRASRIGLFLPCVLEDERFVALNDVLKAHAAWNRDLKRRRDPAAHRIPLTIPRFMTSDEAQADRQLEDDHRRAAVAGNFEEAGRVMEDRQSVGRFNAYFVHDPDEGLIPIYPTTPDDLGHTIEVFRAVEAFINGTATGS
jgi:hypothetical protein